MPCFIFIDTVMDLSQLLALYEKISLSENIPTSTNININSYIELRHIITNVGRFTPKCFFLIKCFEFNISIGPVLDNTCQQKSYFFTFECIFL